MYHTMPSTHANIMPSSSPSLYGHPHFVKETHHTPLSTRVLALVKKEMCTAQNATRPYAPRHAQAMPERARARHWMRQCARSPRCIRPSLAFSSRTRNHHTICSLLDNPTGPRSPYSRRHRRRSPPRYCEDDDVARATPSIPCCTTTRTRTAMTPGTVLHPRPLLGAAVATSPSMTCPVRLGHPSTL
jgi:hypothetical protein